MIGIITNKSVGNDGYVIFFEKKRFLERKLIIKFGGSTIIAVLNIVQFSNL